MILPKLSDFLLDLRRSLAHKGFTKILDISNCYRPSLVHYGGLQRNGMLKAIADVLGVDTNGRTVPLLISLQKQITSTEHSM